MRTLSKTEVAVVNGGSAFTDFLAAIGKTLVKVNVVGKPSGSTDVTVHNNLVDVLVNVIWGKK